MPPLGSILAEAIIPLAKRNKSIKSPEHSRKFGKCCACTLQSNDLLNYNEIIQASCRDCKVNSLLQLKKIALFFGLLIELHLEIYVVFSNT